MRQFTTGSLRATTEHISGLLVAGGSGGIGARRTDPHSEAVRAADGSCSGWTPPGSRAWTAELTAGAGFALLDPATGAVVGAGELGRGRWVDMPDRQDHRNGQCQFPFSATLSPTTLSPGTNSPEIQVAEFPPWPTVATTSDPLTLVGSVEMPMDGSDVPSTCAVGDHTPAPAAAPDQVAKHAYWWTALTALCRANFVVTAIDRKCRPPDVASDHVITTTRPSSRPPGPDTRTPQPGVTIEVATALPCSAGASPAP